MEKNITLSARNLTIAGQFNNIVATIKRTVLKPFEALRDYYSNVLERRINNRQALHLIHAQVAFMFAAFAEGGPLLVRIALIGWFLYAVMACHTALQRNDSLPKDR